MESQWFARREVRIVVWRLRAAIYASIRPPRKCGSATSVSHSVRPSLFSLERARTNDIVQEGGKMEWDGR